MEKTALIQNDEFIQERYDAMTNLERTMQDVNDIYSNLSLIVHHHGDILDNIEMNVTVSANNVSSGTQELHKAEKHQRSARNYKCWLLVILLVILFIISLIIGLTIHK
jgi:t-SNARE complex subunit (syntaxin)